MTTNGIFFDAATGITENRLLNSDELALLALNAGYAQELADKASAKATAKKALLDKLGITADEAALLLG
jgi:hypothetical protein